MGFWICLEGWSHSRISDRKWSSGKMAEHYSTVSHHDSLQQRPAWNSHTAHSLSLLFTQTSRRGDVSTHTHTRAYLKARECMWMYFNNTAVASPENTTTTPWQSGTSTTLFLIHVQVQFPGFLKRREVNKWSDPFQPVLLEIPSWPYSYLHTPTSFLSTQSI